MATTLRAIITPRQVYVWSGMRESHPLGTEASGFTDPRAYFNALIPDIMYGTPPKIRTLTKRVGAAYATVTPEACIYLVEEGRFELPHPFGPNALAVRPFRPA